MNAQQSIDFNIQKGRENRDRGITAAMDHAEAVERGWKQMAYDFLVNVFIKHHKGQFMCEDFRAACKGVVPDPPNLRAFGGIIVSARRAGLIRQVGTRQVKNANANCANAAVWQRI